MGPVDLVAKVFGQGAVPMMRFICLFGFMAFAMLAMAGFAGQTAAEEAGPNASLERFEVSAVKAVRPLLIDTLTALSTRRFATGQRGL